MKKVIGILLVALLCCCTFVSTVAPVVYAENGDSFFNSLTDFAQVSDDKLNELVGSYVDFYQELGSGDILGALTTGAVDIPLEWLGFAGQSLIETADACNVTGVSSSTLVMAADKLKNDSDLMYMVSDVGELLVYDGVNKLIRPVEATDVPKIDGSTFKELCNEYSSTYCPKNTKDFISWRTRTFDEANTNAFLLMYRNTFFCSDIWPEVYLLPFYTDGKETYYSTYQFHFYKKIVQNEDGTYTTTLYCDVWSLLDNTEPKTYTIDDISKYEYIEISPFIWSSGALSLDYYSTDSEYITRDNTSGDIFHFDLINSVYPAEYFSTDLGSSLEPDDVPFRVITDDHDSSCNCNGGHDIGFYCNNKPIEKDFALVDFTKFADDDIVTLKGDTIYDYTITNKEGDITTINNYITNNYTYPVTDTGDSGEEDSGTSAVSSRKVNVNVDVNVNNTME